MPRENDRDRSAPPPTIERSVADAIRIADRYVTHLMNKPPSDPALERTLAAILCALECLKNQGVKMSQQMDDLVAEVANIKGIGESTKVAFAGLRQQIIDAGTDPVKLTALTDSLKETGAGLAAAIVTNPGPTDPPVDPAMTKRR